MGFMRKAMVYLGLQDDDAYEEAYYDDAYDELAEEGPREPGAVRPTREQPEARTEGVTVRPVPAREEPAARPSVVRTLPSTTAARVHVVEPRGFNDAQELGDRLKADQPVILNLQGCDRDLQRRLIDFSSGLTYAVGGSMSRVADQVFLLTPTNVEVSQEEKERLQARGLYRA